MFSGYHPAVNFLYFGMVLGFAMFLLHPACLAVSLGAAVGYCALLKGGRALASELRYLLPTMAFAAILNPVFNHRGATALFYDPWGRPVTWESVAYGLTAAALLGAVILWFSCGNEVLTSDKFIYLFGRTIPALSLVLSMTLRFVPRFKIQFRAVAEAQALAGRSVWEGTARKRVRSAVAVCGILLTWSLENAIDTADSMRSRGYGLPGRTSFSIYTWSVRDSAATVWLLALGGFLLAGGLSGRLDWRYFPTMGGGGADGFTLSLLGAYLALCLTPVLLEVGSRWAWRRMEKGGTGIEQRLFPD